MLDDHPPGDRIEKTRRTCAGNGPEASRIKGVARMVLLAVAALTAGCADGSGDSLAEPQVRAVNRARSPVAIAGCFDLHVGEWDAPSQAGRRHFSLPPTISLGFNFRTDSILNDNYRMEPSVRRGDALYRGRWIYQSGLADSVKLLWSDGREGVLILSETLSNESMTGVAFATFAGDAEPTARAPISMLRTECPNPRRY